LQTSVIQLKYNMQMSDRDAEISLRLPNCLNYTNEDAKNGKNGKMKKKTKTNKNKTKNEATCMYKVNKQLPESPTGFDSIMQKIFQKKKN